MNNREVDRRSATYITRRSGDGSAGEPTLLKDYIARTLVQERRGHLCGS
jgi:hypothetical protein